MKVFHEPGTAAAACIEGRISPQLGRDVAFGDDDGGWIAVATLVEHSAKAPAVDAPVLLRDAVELAEAILGSTAIAGAQVDAAPASENRTSAEIIRMLLNEWSAPVHCI